MNVFSAAPDIHPELTLEQIKQHQPNKAARVSKKDESEKTKLEINTMFDFHTNCALKPLKSCGSGSVGNKSARGKTRRSSVAVMASDAVIKFNSKNKERDYFESHHLNLHTSSSQSHQAVHYLAISPPRIRITDDSGTYFEFD